MAGGSPLNEFTTLMASQGPAWARDPETIVNDASRNTFVLPRFTTGKNTSEMVQGGSKITDTIFLNFKRTAQRYNPNAEITAQNPQTGITWEVPWSFLTANMTWTKQEIGLNKGQYTGKYRTQRYKSVMFQKHQNLWTDVCELMDDEIIGVVPDRGLMEDAQTTNGDPRQPYCLHAFINESPNGLTPAGIDAGGLAWTTSQQINPATAGNESWVCYQDTYGGWAPSAQWTGNAADQAAAQRRLFPALSKCFHQTRFSRLPNHPAYSDKTTAPHVVFCSLEGISYYEDALRNNQDEFRGVGLSSGQDPAYDNPTFRSIPFDYISALNTIALYDNGSSGATTELDATATDEGPRYIGVNGMYMKLVVHSENYCVLEPPHRPDKQPFTRRQDMDCWNNFIARSLRRHFHLKPTGAIDTA